MKKGIHLALAEVTHAIKQLQNNDLCFTKWAGAWQEESSNQNTFVNKDSLQELMNFFAVWRLKGKKRLKLETSYSAIFMERKSDKHQAKFLENWFWTSILGILKLTRLLKTHAKFGWSQ